MSRLPLMAAVGLVAIAVATATYLLRDGAERLAAEPDALPQVRAPSPTVRAPLPKESAVPAASVEPQLRSAEPPPPLPSPRAAASLADADEEPPELAGDTEPGSPHDAQEELAAAHLRLLAKFKAEPRDPTASVEMEAELLNRIAQQPGLALTSLEVECRTSTCRVRLINPNVRDELRSMNFEGFFEDFGTVIVTGRSDPDGSLITELLLARDAAAAQ